jgi:ABC-type nitrate/sulfonate/bicarbonate transport system ATPase subunit
LNVQPQRALDQTQPGTQPRAKIKVERVSKQFLQTKSRLFTKEWTPGVAALKDISIALPEYSFVSVLGPSGCGKTTLLRIVAGLLPASSGAVFIDDQPVTGPRPGSGMVFQYIGLFPWRTVEENVFFSREMQLHRPLTANEKGAARRFVTLVGLSGFEKSFPHQLSGGMQQRVGLPARCRRARRAADGRAIRRARRADQAHPAG